MNKRFVLYAEDDENDAFLLTRAFIKTEFSNLHIVPDGQRAVDYLTGATPYEDRATHPLPSLILLDINMPRLSGLEALLWIRQQPTWSALPVVMFTSSTQEKDFQSVYASGATAYLVKPNNAATLVKIAKLLRGLCLADRITDADFSRIPGYQPRPVPIGQPR